jgi:hypothetical protein
MKKNVSSQSIGAQMVTSADGAAFTGAVSVAVTVDNGPQTAGAGAAPVHEGNGYHSYSPTQAETDGDHIAFTFTGSGAIPATVQVYTNFPQTGDSFARLGSPAGVSVSADIADIPTVSEFNARTLPSASYFDFTTDQVTVSTNNDKTGYTVSTVTDKTGYSISGTKTTLDALNDIAATDIVSAGAITTLAGAVVNVDTVDVCTTNTDMRGTDGANTVAPDNAGITANGNAIAALNDITAADVWSVATRELTSGNNIVLAKGIGITGLNDIAATEIVTGGAINTSSGAVDADTVKINGTTVIGNGTEGNLWRA